MSQAAHVHLHLHPRAHDLSNRGAERWRLLAALLLAAVYMLAEVAGGLASGSLALLADAGHMLTDVAALGLALFALRLAERPPTAAKTFGYHRTEILAALANGALLVAISLSIFYEAVLRLRQPPEVRGGLMAAVAAGGLLVNLASLFILRHQRGGSLNLRGAWLHVVADALGSVEALAAAGLVWAFDWRLADPIASLLIGVLVLFSAWSLLRESVAVLMESTPRGVDVDAVRSTLLAVPGVAGLHDLHVWSITSGFDALSAHVVSASGRPRGLLLADIRGAVHAGFGIEHVTVQVEPDDWEGCPQGSQDRRRCS